MINFNENQIKQINSLKPLVESKFKYESKRWGKLNITFKPLIHDFIDKDISRQDVINCFSDYYNHKNQDVIRPFLLSMIWGFGDTGYGCYRTNKYVESIENRETIKSAIDVLNSDNPERVKIAFNSLKTIDGLGVSYLTKVLYFATRSLNYNEYTLIFDIRVATSLIRLTTPIEIYNIVSILPSTKFIDFEKFNFIMHNIAKINEIDTEKLEMYLFNQEF